MYQELVMPLIGALVLVGWVISCAWALRPAATDRAQPATASHSLASSRAARGITRNGLLGALVTAVVGFLAIRILFELPGWAQLAWVVAGILTAYIVVRVTLLWPNARLEQERRSVIAAHGMQPVRPPWAMIIAGVALVVLWVFPPAILF